MGHPVVSSITSHPRAQVCCVPAASLSSYLRQRPLLEHSTFRQPGPVAGARCGRQLTAAKRVVGGTEAGFGSFPWMALVRAGQARCGGALIGDRWVGSRGVNEISAFSLLRELTSQSA